MNQEQMQWLIDKKVIPALDDFSKEESAFFLFVYYDIGESAALMIVPAPDMEHVEEVLRKTAQEVYKTEKELPSIVIGCERIKYKEESSVGTMDSGLVIVAIEAETAEGFANLYSLPDMELISSYSFGGSDDETPPYTMLAISSFMHETLVQAGYVEDTVKRTESRNVEFRFSRN